MDKQAFGIRFGALSDPISKQIRDQKLKYDKTETDRFQASKDAIVTLRLGGYLSDSLLKKMEQRLFKKIEQHVMKANKLKKVVS